MLHDYFLTLLDWLKINILLKEKRSAYLFKEGDIWWCSVGMNVGGEIFGKGKYFSRPVVILKKFNANLFLGVPFTTQPKTGIWHVPLTYGGKTQCAILSQIRTFDSRRLIDKMGTLPQSTFENIKKSFSQLYNTENIHPASPPSEGSDAEISG